MPNNYTTNLDANINTQKAQNLLNTIQNNRSNPLYSNALQSIQGLFSQMFSAFQTFFTTLGKPTIQLRLQKQGSPAVSADYNSTNLELYNDINLAYKEVNALSNTVVANYNYSEAERQMLSNAIAQLNTDATDYFLYTSGSTSQSVYAGDDFNNNSKINLSSSLAGYSSAQISTTQGVVTLAITGNTDLAPNVLTVTNLTTTLPKWDPASQTGCYEGLFWALQNQLRPEGLGLHLQNSSDGTSLTELGAPEAELVNNRLRMFSGNPDDFWEIEYVTEAITGYQNTQTGQQISVAQYNQLFNNNAGSSAATTIGGVVVASNNGSLSAGFEPIVGSTAFLPLGVTFTVQLQGTYNMNWISLNPNNFGETDYIEIEDIEISSDGTTFSSLPGLGANQDTTLTNLTNQQLSPAQASQTLSPDAYSYAGQGIWSFDPQSVSAIKFTLNQPQAYINPYSILMVTVSQTFTTTTTSSSFFGLFSSTSTSSQTVTENVAIPYLVGQVTGFDVMSLQSGSATNNIQTGLIAGISNLVNGSTVELAGIATGAIAGAVGAAALTAATSVTAITAGIIGTTIAATIALPVIGIALGILAAIFGSSSSSSTSAGPQTITNQWVVTNTDKNRFSIGVTEIGLFAYQFDTQSQITSLPFLSPLPIAAVALDVVENIPSAFLGESFQGQQYDWITYFVSFDNGTTWYQISPKSHGDDISSDGVHLVPQVINVNSGVTLGPQDNPLAYVNTNGSAYSVIFRAVLKRPTTIANANSYSPSLMSYSLQIYPVGGLS